MLSKRENTSRNWIRKETGHSNKILLKEHAHTCAYMHAHTHGHTHTHTYPAQGTGHSVSVLTKASTK